MHQRVQIVNCEQLVKFFVDIPRYIITNNYHKIAYFGLLILNFVLFS